MVLASLAVLGWAVVQGSSPDPSEQGTDSSESTTTSSLDAGVVSPADGPAGDDAEPSAAASAESLVSPQTPAPPVATVESAPVVADESAPVVADEPAPVVADAPKTDSRDGLTMGVFADAYASVNWGFPVSQQGANFGRAYDQDNGFGLAWAGLDIAYAAPKVGATISLRFGQGPNQGWADASVPGAQHVKQAFVTWTPHPKVSLDAGRFDTMIGAEVAESWLNHTYTRGVLYNLAQPFWHTGLRLGIDIRPGVAMKFLAVNGWNSIVDNNAGKSVGGQLSLSSKSGVFGLSMAYLGGPEHPDRDPDTGESLRVANRYWRHLADLVATVTWRRLALAINGDYIYDGRPKRYGGNASWAGVMASTSIEIVNWFYVGARGEFLADPDAVLTGTAETMLGTATGTLDFRPAEHFTLRLEGRYDGSNHAVFAHRSSTSRHQVTTTIGVVVRSF